MSRNLQLIDYIEGLTMVMSQSDMLTIFSSSYDINCIDFWVVPIPLSYNIVQFKMLCKIEWQIN